MVITICNFKGGVGKTTTCHALASAKGISGNKVLVVDLDAQHSLTTSCGIKVENNQPTICELIMADINNVEYDINDINECIVHLKNIDVLPSTNKLNICDRELTKTDRIFALKNILFKIKDIYDYIFLDCSPTKNLLCENALLSSNSVIIPVESYFLGSEGLYEFLKLIDDINIQFKSNLYVEGIILTMFQNTNLCKGIKEYVIKAIKGKNITTSNQIVNRNIKVFNESIPRSIKVAEASLYGKSIVEYLPKNPVSIAYMNIASQINNKVGVN